ncbi:TPA: hypothetical protein ACWP2D_005135, partial [Escherichia coli]
TYVGMTRHKEQAKLYVGADDFLQTGRLVEHGAAPYQNDAKSSLSYYATLENDKGEKHTVWGVDIQRAIAEAGTQIGDKVALEHVGKAEVQLQDGKTTHRNTWQVSTQATNVYEKLCERLGKQAVKESTLDYAEAVTEFAERRDYDGFKVVGRLVERGFVKLNEISDSIKQAVSRVVGHRAPVIEAQQPQQQEAPKIEAKTKPMGFMPKSYSADDLIGAPADPKPTAIERPAVDQREVQQEADKLARARENLARSKEQDHPQQPTRDPLEAFKKRLEAARGEGDGIAIQIAERRLELAADVAAKGDNPVHRYAKIDAQAQADVMAGWKKERPDEYQAAVEGRRAQPQQEQQPQQAEEDAKRAKARANLERAKARGRSSGHGY